MGPILMLRKTNKRISTIAEAIQARSRDLSGHFRACKIVNFAGIDLRGQDPTIQSILDATGYTLSS